MTEELLYRPCVGVVLINQDGLVWSGKRIQGKLPDGSMLWQFPQGGIDEGETPEKAAYRELQEETGIHQARLIYELPYWLTYDLPAEIRGIALKGKFKGQKQKWFAMQYLGDESDINLAAHEQREFETWQWRQLSKCSEIVAPFKKHVYEQIATSFSRFCT